MSYSGERISIACIPKAMNGERPGMKEPKTYLVKSIDICLGIDINTRKVFDAAGIVVCSERVGRQWAFKACQRKFGEPTTVMVVEGDL